MPHFAAGPRFALAVDVDVGAALAEEFVPALDIGADEVVHHGGGRYVSVIGRNALFHNPADRGPGTVDADVVSRFMQVFVRVARTLASAAN